MSTRRYYFKEPHDWGVRREGITFIFWFHEWRKEVEHIVEIHVPMWGISHIAQTIHKGLNSLRAEVNKEQNSMMNGE